MRVGILALQGGNIDATHGRRTRDLALIRGDINGVGNASNDEKPDEDAEHNRHTFETSRFRRIHALQINRSHSLVQLRADSSD